MVFKDAYALLFERRDAMNDRISDLFLERERETLSEFAFLTENTKGRDKPQEPCRIRTEFQRDRDRIIHSSAFRRLMHKTQVFLLPQDELYRTRMTHTLEVTQIARIIARALRLNEDLTEAAALGHDLGHTPFGHAGEAVMRKCFSPRFSHAAQSVRVVEKLEKNGEGLNLTVEVRDGMLNHSGTDMASTLEGVIVKFADRIAYINHDIDDACRAGILALEDIPRPLLDTLGVRHSERINNMVLSVIRASEGKNSICMTDDVAQATDELRGFLFRNVYTNPKAKGEEEKAKALLEQLFDYFVCHPDALPAPYDKIMDEEGVPRGVCDYVSSMTDRYAIDLFTKLFVPSVWKG